MDEKRYCANCFTYKPLSEFGLENSKNPKKGYRMYCKPCYTEIESRRHYEKRLEQNPEKYWECDNCDHIVSIRRSECNKCGAKHDEHGQRIGSEIH